MRRACLGAAFRAPVIADEGDEWLPTSAGTETAPVSPAQLIDGTRYPIADPQGAAARALTRQCRRQLDATGACELPGFLTAAATAQLVAEADALAAEAYHSVAAGTAYLEIPDFSLPADHPRRIVGSS